MSYIKSKYRTHTCAELRIDDVGKSVSLSGWIARKRDHGGVVFLDLRDHYGTTQIVFSEELVPDIEKIKLESVIRLEGEVVVRGKDLVNPKLATGEIEIKAKKLEVLSICQTLPFQVAEDDHAPEAMRLKHRFLELRRDKLHSNITLRSNVIFELRNLMIEAGFLEYQTPILTSSSPEGARDFIVPSRLHPGKFYALPQAPQQFKQLLMIAGFDRYFQVAPCFRDEDARADRSPGEFYQLDLEMSFVEQEDVLTINERIISKLWDKFSKLKHTQAPFERIQYLDAIKQYGTDKPDLRNPLKIGDVSKVFAETGFKVFKGALEQGGVVRAIAVTDKVDLPRKYFDDAIDWYKNETGQGLAYLTLLPNETKGSIAKFISAEELAALRSTLNTSNATVFFAAGNEKQVSSGLGKLRIKLGEDFSLTKKDYFHFCWIIDMPFYEQDPETGKIDFGHNPFSMPKGGLEALNTKDPLSIMANQYDLVCNGYEMTSGAIRNHLPEIMYRAFEIVGYSNQEVDEKFGGMIRAFKFGAPPHGGMAHGIDRIVMLLSGENAIREVIAFPLAQSGEDLLMQAPSTVSDKQLREAHIKLDLPPETKKAAN